MHRNTYLVVIFLAIFAALVVGVNIGKKLAKPVTVLPATETQTPTPLAPKKQTYVNAFCGFSFVYPEVFTKMESASGSAIFTDSQNENQGIAVTCQKDIPRPALPSNRIESLSIPYATGTASISAKLYHDSSPKDGLALDALIFRHPKTGLDIFIAASPSAVFRNILSTVTLLP